MTCEIRHEEGEIRFDWEPVVKLLWEGDVSGWFGGMRGGPNLQEFERQVGKVCGVEHAFGTTSGSSSLYVALRAVGVDCDSLVGVPAYTQIGSVAPILLAGATPLFLDVGPDGNLTAESAAQAAEAEVGALVIVHQLGNVADVGGIKKALPNVPIVEDASHAMGAFNVDGRAGSLGDVAGMSVGGGRTKLIGTGEGGVVLTNDKEVAARCLALRNHGDRVPDSELHCFNFRMSDLAASVGLVQLPWLDKIIAHQKRNAARIKSELPSYLEPWPCEVEGWNGYLIGCQYLPTGSFTRARFLDYMKEHGFQRGPRAFVGPGYGALISQYGAYSSFPRADLKQSQELADRGVWVDWHRWPRTDEDVDRLLEVLHGFGRV